MTGVTSGCGSNLLGREAHLGVVYGSHVFDLGY